MGGSNNYATRAREVNNVIRHSSKCHGICRLDWVCFFKKSYRLISLSRTKQKKIWVISTMQRPVPLEHFLYTAEGGELTKIVDSSRQWLTNNYRNLLESSKHKDGQKKILVHSLHLYFNNYRIKEVG